MKRFAFAALVVSSGCRGCAATPTTEGPVDAATPHDGGPAAVIPIPASAVAEAVNPRRLPAYKGPTGSVEGTLTVVGEPPHPLTVDAKKCPDWGTSFHETIKDGRRYLADAVVAVTGYEGFFIPEREDAVRVVIGGCGFDRRTVTMTFGQRLEVKNESHEFWIPILEPSRSGVMMMAAPGGDPVKMYPKKPGHYLLGDKDRAYVIADLYAFLHPLHATTDANGHYRIDGLPVGKVKVNAMHPHVRGDEAGAELDVKDGVVHKVDLELESLPEPVLGAGTRDAAAPKPHPVK